MGHSKTRITHLCHNVCQTATGYMEYIFTEAFQSWGRDGCIVVWDETVLACKRRCNRGRETHSCWWAHGGVDIGEDGHIKCAHLFFLPEGAGRKGDSILPFIVRLARMQSMDLEHALYFPNMIRVK